jgi:hypothetical protein
MERKIDSAVSDTAIVVAHTLPQQQGQSLAWKGYVLNG